MYQSVCLTKHSGVKLSGFKCSGWFDKTTVRVTAKENSILYHSK